MKIIGQIKEIIKKQKKEYKNFEEVAKRWLKMKKATVKKSTYYNYMFKVNKYLIPEFQKRNITKINNYNEYITKISQDLSYSTVKDIVVVLRSILRYYEEENNCRLNVRKLILPKKRQTKLKILNNKEQAKLEAYCVKENTILAKGIIICLNTGLRIGEICALKWENIDFKDRQINVENTMQRIYKKDKKKTELVVQRAKTETSIRTIPMNNKVYEILKNIQKENKNNKYILFEDGREVVEPRYYYNYFTNVLKANKIKKHKFHILRHTFASNCIEIGMDVKTLSEILGHSDVSITLNIYVHTSDKIKRKYLEKLLKD